MKLQKHQDNELAHVTPILLLHVACSGGSIIFRTLCERFPVWGISEVSPLADRPERPFYPYDPETLLWMNGHFSQMQFELLFKERLARCWQTTRKKGQSLLVREHTHSLFFQPTGIQLDAGFSWIANHKEDIFEQPCSILFSVRDPVDSWLGLNHSFPHIARYSFDEYCRRYNVMLDRLAEATASHKETFLQFKYEDLIQSVDAVLQNISNFVKLPVLMNPSQDIRIKATGNSGRQSAQLGMRPRRAFSAAFLNAAEQSSEYARLAERLEYRHCCAGLGWKDHVIAHWHSVRKIIYQCARRIALTSMQSAKKKRVAD